MIRLTPAAEAQLDALLEHYERLDRIEAARNLMTALEVASARIEDGRAAGLPAPRPYPSLARPGRLSLHVRRYWVAYSTTTPPAITDIYYDTANIPGRV